MNEDVSGWVAFAQDDLRSAAVLYDAGIWNQVCFHAQQCAEKLLKALLLHQGEDVPRTHVIADLLNRLAPQTRTAFTPYYADVLNLDRYYIPTRYPDTLPGVMPGEPDARTALDAAGQVMASVEALLAEGPQQAPAQPGDENA
jgi:HEPN domain-containing protein